MPYFTFFCKNCNFNFKKKLPKRVLKINCVQCNNVCENVIVPANVISYETIDFPWMFKKVKRFSDINELLRKKTTKNEPE